MATARGADSFVELQKTKCEDYFNLYGQATFTRTRRTDTLNAAGRVSGNSTSTLTVKGDLQFVTARDVQYISQGLAVIGDGLFYAPSRYDLVSNDEITAPDGQVYRLTSQVEAETTSGQEIYQGFIAVRLPDND